MTFTFQKSIEVLERTPIVLQSLLAGISSDWTRGNEGATTWSPYDVVGHLIEGEKTDWRVRTKLILSDSERKVFQPFDRFVQINGTNNKPLDALLLEFKRLRKRNLKALIDLQLETPDFDKKGIHPELGEVTLQQLIATWAVHDLNHIAQISRVMAKQYSHEVGPWHTYLKVLQA